jgi:hydrogenase-4 component F
VTSREALALAVIAAPALAAALVALSPRRFVTRIAIAAAVPIGGLAIALAAIALGDPGNPFVGDWIAVDAAGGLLVGVTGVVGLASVLVSPAYLKTARSSLVSAERRERTYFVLLYCFWAVLLGVPLAGNLGAAWLLVEATTAASALLVGFSGKGRALEAGWKYLILTSLGLGVALLGIVLLAAGVPRGGLGALSWHALPAYASGRDTALVAYLLLLAGLAAKIGWAPVHNWLPDAHSEAPAPVSALLSAALLPAVLLVAWRSEQALAPVVGERTAQGVLIAFGLVSLAVAVPFLWRPLAWKRLLAYSSLEHMGVIALGVGFATPLALAGVAVHIAAHAVAKALGFYAATPLLGHEPRAAGHAVAGIGRTQPALGTTIGISLGALAGLPPSPLFVSEVLIVAGGFQAGRAWAAAASTLLLSLGFLGLAHALLDTTAGKAHRRDAAHAPGLRSVMALTAVSVVLLLGLAGLGLWLPGSDLVEALVKGLS